MEVIFMLKAEELKLVSEWDKTFPKSEKVDHEKVTFVNRYGITLAADLYKPKNAFGKYPAIAVSGPFGAVKEQCSGLYAQTMAEKGYLTIAFDPSFTGESGGGQILVCVAGRGYYQVEGKEAVEMKPGDCINIPTGVKHWHGAAPDEWFSHLAIEVPGENSSNEWLEPVSDEEYRKLK